MLIIGHGAVQDILAGRERELVDEVRAAYLSHHNGQSVVPQSSFLRFPANGGDRIIALPAYLGAVDGREPAAGIKWISSFPANIRSGLPRASAVVVLNSLETGRPSTLIEGSLISAKRTAASAALAADLLVDKANPPSGVTLIGCGVINFEVLRFLAAVFPSLSEVTLHDLDPGRAEDFARRCAGLLPDAKVGTVAEPDHATARHPLVSIATTAATPYLTTRACAPGTVVLHVSLRDLHPESIIENRNVVDDADHVCRENTSLHLAERRTGDRRFIDAEIGALIAGTATVPAGDGRVVVFSPFGLGVLDIALANFVRSVAVRDGHGVLIADFLDPQGVS
jgi:ornithine cyclodeaminase